MKWKTNTIIIILLTSIGAVTYFYFEKNSKLKMVNESTEIRIDEGVENRIKEVENEFNLTIENLEKENNDLKDEIKNLKERLSIVQFGGEIEKHRNQIKSNSIKSVEKLKIRKGEVYRDKKSGFVVYVKRDFYEGEVLVNLTLPDRASDELSWEIGKYYYYWNPLKNELSQIMVTFIHDEFVEIEWIFYKEEKKKANR